MRKFLHKLALIGRVFWLRAIPIATLAILFGVLGVQFDKWNVERADASQFINYTDFNVQNARAGEDVYFKVCREHEENYVYNGALTVYVYRDADPQSTPTKVYAKDLAGSIRTTCENKVLRAADFNHVPGTYKMAFCVNFTVKYNIQKTACKDSNIYKIYDQPQDLQSRIEYYEQQLALLRQAQTDTGSTAPSDLTVPSRANDVNSNGSVPSTGQTPAPTQPSTPAQPNEPTQPPARTCAISVLGLNLICSN